MDVGHELGSVLHDGAPSEVHHREVHHPEVVKVPLLRLGHTRELGGLVEVLRGDAEPHLDSPSVVLKVAGLAGRICFGGRRPWGLKMCGQRSGALSTGLVLPRVVLSSGL